MARHAQPRELAELKGLDKKNPQNYRREVPKSGLPLGDAPEHMTDAARDCWREISMHVIDGVLTGADRYIMEIVSNLLAEYRSNPVEFQSTKYGHMISCFARLGMSPADRQKVGVEKKEDEGPVFRSVS